MYYKYYFLLIYFLFVLIACEETSKHTDKANLIDDTSLSVDGDSLTTPVDPVSFISTPETRVPLGAVLPEDVQQIADSNNQFGFKFYQEYIAQQEVLNNNLVFSPWAMSIPLTMLYQGSRATTAEQIQTLMQYQNTKPMTNQAMNELDGWFRESASSADKVRYQLTNSLWIQEDFPIQQDYIDVLTQYYQVEGHQLDMANQPLAASQRINEWVNLASNGEFTRLLEAKDISPLTVLIEITVLSFKAKWLNGFHPSSTIPRPFTLLDNTEVTIDMMLGFDSLDHARIANYQVLELPLEGRQFSMLLILPDLGDYLEVEAGLSRAMMNEIDATLESKHVAFVLPKFDLSTKISLIDLLTQLGMSDSFDGRANFGGISQSSIYISKMGHNAKISIDENGVSATAVTDVGASVTSADVLEISFNRPFIFMIRDQRFKTILFLGRVLDPSI